MGRPYRSIVLKRCPQADRHHPSGLEHFPAGERILPGDVLIIVFVEQVLDMQHEFVTPKQSPASADIDRHMPLRRIFAERGINSMLALGETEHRVEPESPMRMLVAQSEPTLQRRNFGECPVVFFVFSMHIRKGAVQRQVFT